MADVIGVTGNAPYAGIPAADVYWGTPGNQATGSATGTTASVFTSFSKEPTADENITRDNNNEILAIKRTNKGWTISCIAKLVGVTPGAVQTKLQQSIPQIGDVVNISTADTQISGFAYVKAAKPGYTPDGDAVIDFTFSKYANAFVVY